MNGIDWYLSIPQDDAYWTEYSKIGFAADLERMMERSAMSRADLARALGSSPAYITKVLRGDANLTIETMVKLARAAQGQLHLHIAAADAKTRWIETVQGHRGTTAGVSQVTVSFRGAPDATAAA